MTDGSSSEKAITSFVFQVASNPGLLADATATIDPMSGYTPIRAVLPFGTPRTALVASFTASAGARVEVAGVVQQSGVTVNDFSEPVTYSVVAPDRSIASYNVVVDAPRAQQAFFKGSNTGTGDSFGYGVAVSADGNTLAVGAPGEASAALGIGGDELNNGAPGRGAVYVFTRSGATWSQQAYIKASNAPGSSFGFRVTLSADGNTLAVGKPGDESAATGINGDESDTSAPSSGAAFVFVRSGSSWTQQAYVKASNTESDDSFGYDVALSADGNTLAVGASGESSAATGVGGSQTDNSKSMAGAVYVFARSGATWSQQAYVKPINMRTSSAPTQFGYTLALAGDGNTLAVGASDDSTATGVNGAQTPVLCSSSSPCAVNSGAVYVYVRSGTTWSPEAYVKASNTDAFDFFGSDVALSGNGNWLAVGAQGEDSSATGIGGNQSDNNASRSGAAYVFSRSATTWSQQAYLKASNTDGLDEFGASVALSSDGATLAVGAPGESSGAAGVEGDQSSNSVSESGAVYVLTRSGAGWSQQSYVKTSNPAAKYDFGRRTAIAADGVTLVSSADIGVGVSSFNTNAVGVVYVFH